MLEFDIVVVGAGPAGSLTARVAAEAGAKVLLLERAPSREACCAGLVSPATAERLSVHEKLVLRRISGVKFVGPSGTLLELQAAAPKAMVLDRTGLDRWLREKAQEGGAYFRAAAASTIAGNELRLHKSTEKIRFTVVVGADGVPSLVGESYGLPRPENCLVALQATIEAELKDEVFVFLGVSPDFFGWAVPAEEGLARVGLATTHGRRVPEFLRDFLRTHFPKNRVRRWQAGLIPVGPPERTVGNGVLLVGNAAAQVKPLTGGGLAFLSQCAPLAGEFAAQGPPALQGYEKAWRKGVEEEISFQLRARKALLGLGPARVEEILKRLPPKLREFLAKEGDIDSFSLLPRKLRAHPEIWLSLLPLSRWLSEGFLD